MGFLDAIVRSAASTAIRLIDTSATIRRTPEPQLDKETGERFTEDPTDHAIKITPPEPHRVRIEDGSIERRTRLYTPASDLAIVPNIKTDVLILDGLERTLVEVNEIRGGDQAALYELQFKQ